MYRLVKLTVIFALTAGLAVPATAGVNAQKQQRPPSCFGYDSYASLSLKNKGTVIQQTAGPDLGINFTTAIKNQEVAILDGSMLVDGPGTCANPQFGFLVDKEKFDDQTAGKNLKIVIFDFNGSALNTDLPVFTEDAMPLSYLHTRTVRIADRDFYVIEPPVVLLRDSIEQVKKAQGFAVTISP